MEIYENTTSIIDSNMIYETIAYLKEAFKKISDKLLEIKHEKEEEAKFKKEARILKQSMRELSDLLREYPLFKEKEHINFLTIEDITIYFLDERELYEKHYDFINTLLMNFFKIILKKLDCQLNEDLNEYQREYDEFKSFLIEQEEYFLMEIYEDDDLDDEFLKELDMIIEGD